MKRLLHNGPLRHSLNPKPYTPFSVATIFRAPVILTSPSHSFSSYLITNDTFPSLSATYCCCSSMGESGAHSPSSSLEKQFEEFRVQLEDSGRLRERIRAVALEIESATRLMHSCLLLVHQSRPLPGTDLSFGYISLLYICLLEG